MEQKIHTEDRKRLAIGIDPFFSSLQEPAASVDIIDSQTTKVLKMIQDNPDNVEKILKFLELLG